MPDTFSRADAIFNASRCALLVRALATGDHAGLRVAMQDRWHQDARFALMPGSREIVEAGQRGRRVGSSAGRRRPVGYRLTQLGTEPVVAAMAGAAASAGVAGQTMVLPPRNYGTRVDVSP